MSGSREIENGGLDAIIVTASGCGTTIKDYGFMLRLDPAYAGKAARISALARDVTEYLATLDLPEPACEPGLAVAYHSACSMQHGQKITRQPKELLAKAGFVVREPREGHLCCGSAGTYNIMQPEIANATARPQGEEHRGDRRRRRRHRQYRLHHADRRPRRHADRAHGANCSTGPMAGRSRTGL